MKRLCILLAMLWVLLALGGCGFWMDGERVSVEPYQMSNSAAEKLVVKVSNYAQMQDALEDMVQSGAKSILMDVSDYIGGPINLNADTAVRYVQNSTALGAYAVERINYEIGTSTGTKAVSVEAIYRYEKSRFLEIQRTENMEQALSYAADALNDADPYAVVHVSDYEKMDITQWVKDYSAQYPDLVMETPAVKVSVYPEEGSDRIVEMEFTYQNSRDALKQMQQKVKPVFTAAELYVENAVQLREKYAQLYAFLMERFDYQIETSLTPAYSLLNYGVGDCRAFANTYAAMCRNADLECYVVSGSRDGAPWTWNIIHYYGTYYHLDLLKCMNDGDFLPRKAEEMSGYVWDYSAYPN